MRYSYHTSKNSDIKAIKKRQTYTVSQHNCKAFLLSMLLAVVAALALVIPSTLQAQAAPQNNQFTWDPDTGTLTIGADCTATDIADYLYTQGAVTGDLITIDVVSSIDFSGDLRIDYISLKSFIVEKGASVSFPQGCANLFIGLRALEEVTAERFNLSNVEDDISYMFNGCNALKSLNVEGWDTRNIKNAQDAFNGCSALTELNVSKWNTQNVKNMAAMFGICSSLKELNVSSFNTSNVTNMSGMFTGCTGLTSLDVKNFDTKNVQTIQGMFQSCSSLKQLDISSWNLQSCTNFALATIGCTSLEYLNAAPLSTVSFASDNMNFSGLFGDLTGSVPQLFNPNEVILTAAYASKIVPIYKQLMQEQELSFEDVNMTGGWCFPSDNYTAYKDGKKVSSTSQNIFYLLQEIDPSLTSTDPITFYKEGYIPPVPDPDPDDPEPGQETGWNFNESGGWYYVYDNEGHTYNDGWHWIEDTKLGNHWYYFKQDSFIATNQWMFTGAWYYVNSSGAMNVGTWNYIDGSWYGFNWNGTMCTGWVWNSSYNNYFYCDETTGAMYTNCWSFINDTWYGFHYNGEMCRGWVWDSSYRGWFYCSPSDGHMYAGGWYRIGNKPYYFNASGLLI